MARWPDIPYERWAPTGGSLRMWAQIVGKFRFALTPLINHSWQAAFYIDARGFSTALIPGENVAFDAAFAFVDHALILRASDGGVESLALREMSVASFFDAFRGMARRLGADVEIHGAPNEIPDPVPFADQTDVGAYDPAAAQDFWRALLVVDAAFKRFRTGFVGKASPVHLFWGSFDLAVTRFSGRAAPPHPGGIPALPDVVTREAYSHEVSSAGFWPGGGPIDAPAFYAYAYPTPAGFGDADPGHPDAYYDDAFGEFVLPYDAVRASDDPQAALIGFLQATYEAAADLGGWNRADLECALGEPRRPRPL
ncbi:MAG: DUF5996 family protein [Parvularculaceae bacterium]